MASAFLSLIMILYLCSVTMASKQIVSGLVPCPDTE